jgi:hypothetical protein
MGNISEADGNGAAEIAPAGAKDRAIKATSIGPRSRPISEIARSPRRARAG